MRFINDNFIKSVQLTNQRHIVKKQENKSKSCKRKFILKYCSSMNNHNLKTISFVDLRLFYLVVEEVIKS